MGGSPQSLRKPRHCFVVIREHAKRCAVRVRQRLSDEGGSILLGKGQDRRSRRLNEWPEAPDNVRDFHDCGRVYRRGRVAEITEEGESRLTTGVMVDPSEDIFPFRRVGIFARDCDQALIDVDDVCEWHRSTMRLAVPWRQPQRCYSRATIASKSS